MPRDNPKRITKQKLLRHTGQQADCKQIKAQLDRHESVVAQIKKQGKINALKHAIYVCDSKNLSFKNEAYRCACDEIKVSLQAAMERLEAGEEMIATSTVQWVTQ